MNDSIRLRTVQAEERSRLYNINQKYLHEMTAFYPDEMDAQGNYHYGNFDAYFIEPERKAFFIFNDETMIGFAMICPHSYIGHNPDYTMAEFTIFPPYRRNHFALDAAKMILSEFPGRWEIKYHERNTGAKKLWSTVAMPYNPTVFHLNDEETVLEFVNRENAD